MNILISYYIFRHNHERKCFEARIGELEEDLILKVNENEEMRNEIVDLKIKMKMPAIQEVSVYEEESEQLENKITELMTLLQEKNKRLLECEESCKYLESQNSEMQDIIQVSNKIINPSKRNMFV